jgi:integrase
VHLGTEEDRAVAQWIPRERTDGGVSIQIKWRMDGRWQSETFTDPRAAAEFRLAVEQAGHRWPDGWIKRHGWVAQVVPAVVPAVGTADPASPADEGPTFADVALGEQGFFARQERRARLKKIKPKTVHDYRRDFEQHLAEHFGPVAFADIDADDIADWIDTQIEAGLAAKTIRNLHGLLSSIMKHGVLRLKLRPENPCQASELPDVKTATSQVRQLRFFQPEEWGVFRSCLAPDVHLLLDLDLATGLRWGELAALQVGDISFTTAIDPASGGGHQLRANVHVVRAWSRRSPDDPAPIRWDEGEDRQWVLGPPKSKRPRWVVVSGEVAERLHAVVRGRAPSEYAFTTREGRPWRYQNFYHRRWKPARDKAQQVGLTKRITPHMLRHTTVVWSLAEGVAIEKVSEMIGHASLQVTYDIYGGLLSLTDPAMATAMARAMVAATPQQPAAAMAAV